jgi:hypothetical protein
MASPAAVAPPPTSARQREFKLYRPIEHDGQRGVELKLHAGQIAAWDATERIVAVISGTQGGKTSFGPWWLLREVQQKGPGDYLAVTATFDLFKLKMLPALQEVFIDLFDIARYWSGDGVLELCEHEWDEDAGTWAPVRDEQGRPVFGAERASDVNAMWGRIVMRSASATGGLEAATAKAAWLDEAGQDQFTLQAYNAIRRRLSIFQGRILITTTPYNLGWLKQRIYDPWRAGADHIKVINFPSTQNPAFPVDEFEQRKDEMEEWEFNMFYLGLFERPAGLIYASFIDEFREKGGHKVKPFPIPREWPRYGGIDPGGANHAKVWVAEDPQSGNLFAYRESLTGGKSTEAHAGEIRSYPDHQRIVLWYVGAPSETQQRMDYQAEEIFAWQPPIADVEAGISRVNQQWRTHRLFVFDTCEGLIDQLGSYRRKLDDQGQVMDEIQDKRKYHLLDALRYVIVGITDEPEAEASTIEMQRAGT